MIGTAVRIICFSYSEVPERSFRWAHQHLEIERQGVVGEVLCFTAEESVRIRGEQSSLFLIFLIFCSLQGNNCVIEVFFSWWYLKWKGMVELIFGKKFITISSWNKFISTSLRVFWEGFEASACFDFNTKHSIMPDMKAKWGIRFTKLLEEQKCRQQCPPLSAAQWLRDFVHQREGLGFVPSSGCMGVDTHLLLHGLYTEYLLKWNKRVCTFVWAGKAGALVV